MSASAGVRLMPNVVAVWRNQGRMRPVRRLSESRNSLVPDGSRVLLLLMTATLFACIAAAPERALAATGSGERSAAQELADRYSPVMMIREQDDPLCGIEGEQYQPMAVDALFDNPEVTLRRNPADGGRPVPVTKAPSLSDVAAAGENAFLDLNGDPLGDTCVFATDFDALKRAGRAPVAVYAHIAREKGREGIALQYWFFWYFNEFNDLHEGDWEGMQITFDASSPEEALGTEPSEMILFQHAGGERAEWNDAKVEKEGSHPVVYPAAGSHATFYRSAVFVGNGSRGSGVGCDNTAEPLRRLDPEAVLLPDRPPYEGRFAWLGFDGRWGQKEKGFNNGPTGPQTKTQWSEPFTWMEDQRWSSPRMPGGGVVGPQATGAFCTVIEDVTSLMNLQQSDPLATYLIVALILIVAILLFGVTRWRPARAGELEIRRSYGQIMAASAILYGRHWRVLAVLGAISIPIVGGTQLAANVLSNGGLILLGISDLIATFGQPAASAVVAATIIVFVGSLASGGPTGVKPSLVGTRKRFWRVVTAQILAILGVAAMALTVIGIPFAVWKLVGWSFVQQEVLYTDKSIRGSFRGSSDLVRGRWWHALRTVLVLQVVGVASGPALVLFLIFTPFPLFLVNLLSSVVFALVVPYTTVGRTLLYFDLKTRAKEQPAKPARSWAVWKPRQFARRRDLELGPAT